MSVRQLVKNQFDDGSLEMPEIAHIFKNKIDRKTYTTAYATLTLGVYYIGSSLELVGEKNSISNIQQGISKNEGKTKNKKK